MARVCMTSIIRISYLNTFEVDHTCRLKPRPSSLKSLLEFRLTSYLQIFRVNGQCNELVLRGSRCRHFYCLHSLVQHLDYISFPDVTKTIGRPQQQG